MHDEAVALAAIEALDTNTRLYLAHTLRNHIVKSLGYIEVGAIPTLIAGFKQLEVEIKRMGL